MKEAQLIELYDINFDLYLTKKELEELKEKPMIKPVIITDMPRGNKRFDSMIAYLERKEQLVKDIETLEKKKLDKQAKIDKFLNGIKDIELRTIIKKRALNHDSWEAIGDSCNMHRTTAMRRYNKFFSKR